MGVDTEINAKPAQAEAGVGTKLGNEYLKMNFTTYPGGWSGGWVGCVIAH